MEFLFELFKNIPRQGPGSEASTLKALSKIKLPDNPNILDVGCGTGNQTLTLAKKLNANIKAVDIHQPFLDIIYHLAYHLKLKGRISTSKQSMFEMKFRNEQFHLIWSEGAVYIMGFENGLKNWMPFLKPEGYIALTEISWFKKNPPSELKKFWDLEYPALKTIEENLQIVEKLGLNLIDHFSLPVSDWWDELYNPLKKRIEYFKKKYKSDLDILSILFQTIKEIDLYNNFSDYYGYEFYILQKK